MLLAFLLVVPFNQGYKRLDRLDKDVYFVALICLAGAAICLIAPSVHHRILFRHGQRPFIISLANRLAITGMTFLAVGLLSILILLSRVVFGDTTAVIIGVLAFVSLGVVWFAIPLARRIGAEPDPRAPF